MVFVAKISGSVAYLERPGHDTPLLLLHGIGSNAEGFASLLPNLPAGRRVVAWDAPGYGGSKPLAADWPDAGDYVQALTGLLDRLEIDQAIIVGHSLGTLMGAAFARHHAGRVAALVLASCACGHGVPPGAALPENVRARIDDLQKLGPDAFAARRAPRLVFEPERNLEVTAFVTRNMSRVRMPGYGQAMRMLASGRLLDDLVTLSVPASIIVGLEDVVTPPQVNRHAHAAIPARFRGPLVELPDAGHAIYQQTPAAFARAVAACLDQTMPVRMQACREE